MTLLALNDVSFGWPGGGEVLRSITLRMEAGDGLVISGRNGSGKSSLLNLCAGFVRPTRGTVTLQGHPAHSRRSLRQRWFMETQPALYRLLTVGEQLDFYSRAHGQSADRALELARSLTEPTIDEALCATLSSGQAQKVWFAASIAAHSAPLLLLDEPFSAVDDESAAAMAELIENERVGGRAIVVITHVHRDLIPPWWSELNLSPAYQRR